MSVAYITVWTREKGNKEMDGWWMDRVMGLKIYKGKGRAGESKGKRRVGKWERHLERERESSGWFVCNAVWKRPRTHHFSFCAPAVFGTSLFVWNCTSMLNFLSTHDLFLQWRQNLAVLKCLEVQLRDCELEKKREIGPKTKRLARKSTSESQEDSSSFFSPCEIVKCCLVLAVLAGLDSDKPYQSSFSDALPQSRSFVFRKLSVRLGEQVLHGCAN